MPTFTPLITEQQIQEETARVATQISKDYEDKDLILMGILKGSFIFLADLSRKLTVSHEVDLLGASSYQGTASTGALEFTKYPDLDLKNRDILLVEDIVDTGRTLVAITEYIENLNPNSLKICTLIDKHERRELNIKVDYACFSLEKGFIVGYGLDYNEKYRHLPAIYDLEL
ncbi:MAG: hypoxanthine phosphoribosyltransferase [Desulfobacteraceae bacterium]|nr:MAG: hypoxanthine phosphoribosyltransferase [Desulfobacteraceae bacterium]